MLIEETAIVQLLRRRDEKALEHIINQYGGLMKGISQKHLYHLEHLQEECINETLLAVWYNIDSYSGENSFKNWLAAITRYKAIDSKRKYLRASDHELLDHCVDHLSSNGRMLLEHELSEDFENLINCLCSEDRELFKKFYLEEKDMNTLVQESGLKSTVIYNRLSRGRKKLWAQWKGHEV